MKSMINGADMQRRDVLRSAAALVGSTVGMQWASNAFAAAPKKVALVVGNAAYQANERLKNAVADATLTAKSLESLGFAITLATDRTTPQLKSDLDTFVLSAADADIALFFYAGHGIAVENVNYLIPVDQRLGSLKSIDLKREGTSLRWVESLLKQSRAAVTVMLIDACRNPLMRSAKQQGMVDRVKSDKVPHGLLTFFSTAPGAVAGDGAGKNSDFTAALNRYLTRSELTLKQIVDATTSDVSAVTGATQIPWVSSGLVNDVKLSIGQSLAQTPTGTIVKSSAASRGSADASTPQKFWDENLARLDEQIQMEAVNFDINRKPVLEQRAAKGDVMALTILGLVYSTPDAPTTHVTHGGYGLESREVRNGNGVVQYAPAIAAQYFSKAANKQFPVAQTMLAELLVAAPRGVPRDYVRAEKLLQEAARTGYGRARLNLLDLNSRRGKHDPEQIAKELMNNTGTFKKYLEQWSVPGK